MGDHVNQNEEEAYRVVMEVVERICVCGRHSWCVEQGPRFADYGLVVVILTPEHLSVGHGGVKIGDSGRITLERIEQTIITEEPAEPPTSVAATGAARWTKRKVVMNGRVDPCARPKEGQTYLQGLMP